MGRELSEKRTTGEKILMGIRFGSALICLHWLFTRKPRGPIRHDYRQEHNPAATGRPTNWDITTEELLRLSRK